MLDFLGNDGNLPFVGALALMIGIALLEGVGAILGLGFSRLADTLVPDSLTGIDSAADIDIDADFDFDADIDTEIDVDLGDADAGIEVGGGFLTSMLGWLCVGRVPVLILLIFFLTAFGLVGLGIQGFVQSLFGVVLPSAVAVVPSLILAVPAVRLFGRSFAKFVPKVETTAVSKDTFIGRVASVIRGEARRGQPAEAKLEDRFGKTHYVLVEPDIEGESFNAGDEVLLVRRRDGRFWAIRNPHELLSS